MKYIGMNIGPVVKTLSLARKPRELWTASYLFSFLMECIVDEAGKYEQIKIIAPKKWDKTCEDNELHVGLYPDRIYMSTTCEIDADGILDDAWNTFSSNVPGVKREYFNLMYTSCEADSEVEAIAELNRQLDVLELCMMASESDSQEDIMRVLQQGRDSVLYKLSGDGTDFSVDTLAEIAAAQLKMVVADERWREFANEARKENGSPYSRLGGGTMSFHRYFCVVQADGDNMGKTLTNMSLPDGSINMISESLLQFGKDATRKITGYEGMPVYAGGDDLLFLAPVLGRGSRNIFDLIDELEDAFAVVRAACRKAIPDLPEDDLPSLSFGVTISFYKYPLYETLASARKLLFGVAKNVPSKKAIAWKLEKHSGESFEASFSRKDPGVYQAYRNVINNTVDGQTVTQAIHKSRKNWMLLSLCLESGDSARLDAFFKTLLEETSQNKLYLDAVKSLMVKLYAAKKPQNDEQMKIFAEDLYSMLRTAKFIKGEDTKDE